MSASVSAPRPTSIPRAPSVAVWNAMTPEERAAHLDSLPTSIPELEGAPEGDEHWAACAEARQVVSRHFARLRRRVYVSGNIYVYYTDEQPFAPDFLAVLDVDPKPRTRWHTVDEGRGVDLVLEVLVRGDAHKDLDANLRRYAGLGIREYFVFDRRSARVLGWRIPSPGLRTYTPLLAQHGWLRSDVLDAEIGVEGQRLRFRVGDHELWNLEEAVLSLEDRLNDAKVLAEEQRAQIEEAAAAAAREAQRAAQAEQAAQEEKLRAEQAERLAEQERLRADALAAEAAALRAELERLRGR